MTLSFYEILPIRNILYWFLIIYDNTSNSESKTTVKGTNTEHREKKNLLQYFVLFKLKNSWKWAI